MTGEDVAARVHAYAWTDRKPGLERTRALLAALGNPEKALCRSAPSVLGRFNIVQSGRFAK